ncbi:MAG: ATP-binding cassette domain-containing protein [Planctomycetaceae bacterium]
MLQLRNITKRYDGKAVLRDVDVDLQAGKTHVLIGPSGCGKSTVLRLIVGLIDPDDGTVVIDGKQLTAESAMPLRRRMGYVIQEGGLFPHLTAEANVALMARYLKWEEKRIANRLKELADLTHLPLDGLSRYPAQLSGGQRQRVSLMRALMMDPDLLLLDEPLGALDPMIRAELQRDLREIFRTLKKTVVLVTHDLGEAAYLGERVFLLREGVVVQDGAVDDFLKSPADPFVTDFINAQRSP